MRNNGSICKSLFPLKSDWYEEVSPQATTSLASLTAQGHEFITISDAGNPRVVNALGGNAAEAGSTRCEL